MALAGLVALLAGCSGPQTLRVAQDPIGYARNSSFVQVSFSPERPEVAAGSADKGWTRENCSVLVFDLESGREVRRSRPPREWGRCRLCGVAYHPTRGLLLACYRPKTKEVLVWPVAESQPLLQVPTAKSGGWTVFAPGGRRFCLAGTGTNDGVWDLDTAQRRFALPFAPTSATGFSEDGQWLAVGARTQKKEGRHHALTVYNAQSGQCLWSAPTESPARAVAVSASNQLVLAVTDHVQVWSLTNGVLVQNEKPKAPSAGEKAAGAVWDLMALVAGRVMFGNLTESYAPEAVSVSLDGSQWLMAGPDPSLATMLSNSQRASALAVVDIKSGQVVSRMVTPAHSGWDHSLAMSPDGRLIALAGGSLFVVEARTGALWTGAAKR